ncbi:TIR domain-containing protein [Streptomyces sp. NPDC059649]|uniref:TIR domain-containing protein n=1 Tax=Streptomyces sp. NPDC059649 TaxID=3346895 RepID=UPI0036CE609F
MARPSLFVGSSSEGLRIAEAVQVVLDDVCEVELWTQGSFGLTQGTLESLVSALPRFDFALLVLTADDLTVSRNVERPTARDNVLFELGLFIGALGRDRTFMLYDRTNPPAMPSDLAGIAAATFAPQASGNLEAALGAPCTKIRRAVERLGARADKRFRDLEKATTSVEDVGATMQSLLRLLARSRKVELDIIATQFGRMIDPRKLQQMKQDLADLDRTLGQEENPRQ